MADFSMRPAPDAQETRQLLADAGLPDADLTEAHFANFIGAYEHGRLIGVAGLEWHDGTPLLRSLAVEKTMRHRGLGHQLMNTLEARARREGAQEIYLLTLNAAPYFLRMGYGMRPREMAPAALKNASQFSTLCPSTATLMVKRLT